MHFKLWHKFALALIITSALTLLAALYISQQSFKRGFLEYLNAQERERIAYLAKKLLIDYQQKQDWSFVVGDLKLWHRYLRNTFDSARREGLFGEVRPADEQSNRRPPPTRRRSAAGSDGRSDGAASRQPPPYPRPFPRGQRPSPPQGIDPP